MDFTVVIALILGSFAVLLFFLYRFLTRDFGYWEAQGIPSVKPQIIFGSVRETFSKPPADVENERYKKYGRLYGTYEFHKRALNIADPDLARQILVQDFHIFPNRRYLKINVPQIDYSLLTTRDETWKRIRNVVSPCFTSTKLRKLHCHFAEAAEGLINNFSSAADSQEIVDAKTHFSSYSIDVIGLCAFGIRVDSLRNPDHPFTVHSKKFLNRTFSVLDFLIFFVPLFGKIFGQYLVRKWGIDYFIEVSEEIIRKRREEKQQATQVHFINLLLDAREENDDNKDEDVQRSQQPTPKITKKLSDLEIHAQTAQFFLLGHDTISTSLSFVAYELALNPDIQERLFQEVTDVYKAHGEFNYDIVAKMTFLDAVISESLRLHTISAKAEREASEDYVLGSTGITVPKGCLIMILIHAMHHDPEWYPDPEKFQPDRFMPENRSSLNPSAYLPFGDGPRICVGIKFALLEMKLCLAMVLRKIRFVATDETKEPVKYFHNPGLLIPKEVKMRVEKRT